MKIRAFDPKDFEDWDAYCNQSICGTFLHTRQFLSYHGKRFHDKSLIIEDANGRWLGILPAAEMPGKPDFIVSHPGITYGGVVHAGRLAGSRMIEALKEICTYYEGQGYTRLLYKAVPYIYHRAPAQDDLYALFHLGAALVRCDLSCAVDLSYRLPVNNRRKRALKKAQKAGVLIKDGRRNISELWDVLGENLEKRHHTRPVHSVDEIRLLAEWFPENIHFRVALLDHEIIAGIVLFTCNNTIHTQYLASSERGYATSALDAIIEETILEATKGKKRYFDFGISTENHGHKLNDGLYKFKNEFGGGGVAHEFYEIKFGI